MGCVPSDEMFEPDSDSDEDVNTEPQAPLPRHHVVKCILIGDNGVGKSALMRKYADNVNLHEYKPTNGIDFALKTSTLHDGLLTTFQIWDTSAHERFKTMIRSYLKRCSVIMCYDITNRRTFDNIKDKWMNEVDSHAHYGAVKILIGSKCDVCEEREVSYQQGQSLANTLGVYFFETSIYFGHKEQRRKSKYIIAGYIRRHRHLMPSPDLFSMTDIMVTCVLRFYHRYRYYANGTRINTVFTTLAQLLTN